MSVKTPPCTRTLLMGSLWGHLWPTLPKARNILYAGTQALLAMEVRRLQALLHSERRQIAIYNASKEAKAGITKNLVLYTEFSFLGQLLL